MELQYGDLDVGQVLVSVQCAGICGAQVGEITGAKGPDAYLPHLLGHEGGGIVVDIGPGVKTVTRGDRVVMHWRKGTGIDANPPKYRNSENEVIGAGSIATFAEYSIVSENRLTRIGDDIPFDIAALMGCAVTTGLGLVNNEAQLKIGQSIAVAGVGGVGLNVIQGAELAGAGRIIAIDIKKDKLKMALKFGATIFIENKGSFLYGIKETGGLVDVFVDCTGVPGVINEGIKSVRPGGKIVLVGQPPCGTDIILTHASANYCGKTMIDSQGGLTNPAEDIPRYLNLYRTGILKIDNLITHRFKLHDINKAIKTMRSGIAGRCMLEM
jgi:S-(hydroxymethyl)glutathione dehydrogenase/alcohol dehydrogenase